MSNRSFISMTHSLGLHELIFDILAWVTMQKVIEKWNEGQFFVNLIVFGEGN